MSNETPIARAQEWATKVKNAIEPWQYLGALALLISGALATILGMATPILMLFAPVSLVLVVCVTWLLVIACAWLALSFTRSVFGWPRRNVTLPPASSSNAETASGDTPRPLRSWQRKPLDLKTWRRVDPLSLAQVAYLWNDREPPAGKVPHISSDVDATYQMLLTAAAKREIQGNFFGEPGSYTLLTRAALKAYAALHGDTPKFLTDAD